MVWSVADRLGPAARFIATLTVLTESDAARYTNPLYPLSATVPNDGPPPKAYAESTKDSLGLFQQRPKWWGQGTLDDRVGQLMDAEVSSELFIAALSRVKGWQEMPSWEAAQAVQGSEYLDGSNYKHRVGQAQRVLAAGGTYFTDGGR